jgi:acetylornithine aminotransferase
MTKTATLQARWDATLMHNYGTPPIALVSGNGCQVTDADGNSYLDLIAGIAVSSLGHAHPAVVEAVTDQIGRIAHTSNLVINEPALALAERLVTLVGVEGARVFLSNDGATANEAAIKAAIRAQPGRRRFVAAEGSFHGRTLGALALTGKAAIREPFEPLGLDTTFVPYGDADALAGAVDGTTAAVFLEPTLGEAGVIPPPAGYLSAARAICDDAAALLVIDEVQGGIGRTGAWFAHQHEAVVPDLITVAKGLGGGLPVGACVGTGRAADALVKGDHGSTFGGNPVSCAAALAVIDTIERQGLLTAVESLGASWMADLAAVSSPLLSGVRGRGLWLALVTIDGAAPAIEAAARDAGFLVNATGPGAVRLAPPLVLTEAEAASFTAALPAILDAAASAARLSQ